MTYRLVVVTVENEILRALPSALGDDVSVQIFESANDALWELRVNPPEAVIAEVELPGMTGLELAEIIPNFEIQTNVLLYSPSLNDSARKQAEALGVYTFLHGPGAAGELHAAIQAALHDAHMAAEAAAAEPEEEDVPEPEAEPEPEAKPRRMAMRPVSPAPPAARPSAAQEPKAERRDFTPARVVLPSAREREQAAAAPPPPPPPARGGLASRTRAAVDRKPEPKPRAEPTPEPTLELPGRRSSGTLVVTAENINAVRKDMSQLAQELGAQSVMLTDRAGMVLVDVGTTDGLLMMSVLPLLSMSFSTSGEVARQLQEEDALTVYIHEGMNYDLYCFDVVQRFLLVLVFNKKIASSKIGSVWINAKRAIRELRDNLAKT
ncbi:response regulator [Oscillochloris sp. ZM17-4]|uniref:response regulator n=1 Tax=Oscillochloris sp. ZM17-4 TaxID=2866714 RepID=UPI001C73D50B|nr:response regulator [Oscillochloris sp. ZM17-4]MBX0327941.1 response regulator [Oscillochloris sp. ZM17-4]